MKRRDFLKLSPAVSLPFLLNGLPIQAAAQHPILQLLAAQTAATGRVLVLVQLAGGNDGLNTLIPLDQYNNLVKARSNILIPENRVLPLNGVTATGFHPSMTGMQGMYNSNQMNIVQAASYSNPSFSHFRATDIWFTGSDSQTTLATGWLGRYLQATNPNYPAVSPTDPLAVEIGSQASLITQCNTINAAVTVTDPTSFYELIDGVAGSVPDSPYGHELTFVRLIKQQTSQYINTIKNAFNSTAAPAANYPAGNALADQLKIVARLIHGGLATPVYVVNHPQTFDTHGSQVDQFDTTIGNHATLLATLSDAMTAFQQDLINRQVDDRVVAMTVTEFGRRIKSNDSLGSDHGAATPIFFFGTPLNPTIIGTNPAIPDAVTVSDQVNMQYDFKQVYYTVLKDWFQLGDDVLAAVFPQAYTVLPIFRQIALPVKLVSFTGVWTDSHVDLNWKVDAESGIDRYEVQRSDDGISFTKIGVVTALNNPVAHGYTFTDSSLSKSFYYYRIRIIEQSGTQELSSVLLLKGSQSTRYTFKVYPNPVTDRFTVTSANKINGTMTVSLTDLTGKEIWKDERQVSNSYEQNFSIANKKPAAGIYIVKMHTGGDELTAKIVIR